MTISSDKCNNNKVVLQAVIVELVINGLGIHHNEPTERPDYPSRCRIKTQIRTSMSFRYYGILL